jgi:hypothetical protein
VGIVALTKEDFAGLQREGAGIATGGQDLLDGDVLYRDPISGVVGQLTISQSV